jgi:hypothetical protein
VALAELIGRFSSRVDDPGDDETTQRVFELLKEEATKDPISGGSWNHPLGMIDPQTFVTVRLLACSGSVETDVF